MYIVRVSELPRWAKEKWEECLGQFKVKLTGTITVRMHPDDPDSLAVLECSTVGFEDADLLSMIR